MVIFLNRLHPYRRVAVVYWLNYLIQAVALRGSSTQHQVKHVVNSLLNSSNLLHYAAPHGFQCYIFVQFVYVNKINITKLILMQNINMYRPSIVISSAHLLPRYFTNFFIWFKDDFVPFHLQFLPVSHCHCPNSIPDDPSKILIWTEIWILERMCDNWDFLTSKNCPTILHYNKMGLGKEIPLEKEQHAIQLYSYTLQHLLCY